MSVRWLEACPGCGGTPATPLSKWCSGRCRKQTLYAGKCVDCGAPTNGYDGPAMASKRCIPCDVTFRSETRYWTPDTICAAFDHMEQVLGRPFNTSDVNPWVTRSARGIALHKEHRWPPLATTQREIPGGVKAWRAALAEWRSRQLQVAA